MTTHPAALGVFGGIALMLFALFIASTRRAPMRVQHEILRAVTVAGVASGGDIMVMLRLGMGATYPYLRQLERDGLLRAFEDTRSGRPRTYYQITAKGEAFLQARSA